MERESYPALYQASSTSAKDAQKTYFRLLKLRIALLLVIAGIASFSWDQLQVNRTLVAILVAAILVIWLSLTIRADAKRADRTWFSSRSIAESVKTESWRFMMNVSPYDEATSNQRAERILLNRFAEIIKSQSFVLANLTSCMKDVPQITEQMKSGRQMILKDRKAMYLKDRIRDQKNWYIEKTKLNQTQQYWWSGATWIFESAAVAIAVATIFLGSFLVNPVGILTTAIAGATSWMNAKSYRELSQSYSLIAHELMNLEAQARRVTREREMSDLVMSVERAISREHSVWLERRLV